MKRAIVIGVLLAVVLSAGQVWARPGRRGDSRSAPRTSRPKRETWMPRVTVTLPHVGVKRDQRHRPRVMYRRRDVRAVRRNHADRVRVYVYVPTYYYGTVSPLYGYSQTYYYDPRTGTYYTWSW